MEWIKTSEEKPAATETSDFWIAGRSDQCIVVIDGCLALAYYWTITDRWAIDGHTGHFVPSHWMYAPKLPIQGQ